MRKFNISFTTHDAEAKDNLNGNITLDEIETFSSSLNLIQRALYEENWRNAISGAVLDRKIGILIIGYDDLEEKDLQLLRYFTLIPSEDARGGSETSTGGEGIYITESFRYVTSSKEKFYNSYFRNFENEIDDEVAVYFFDPKFISGFKPFLDNSICGVSYWYYENECFSMEVDDKSGRCL